MKKRLGIILAVIATALIIGLLIWRFWPQPSSALLSVDETSITGFSAYAMVHQLEDGQTRTETYGMGSAKKPSGDVGEILEILSAAGYRQDFRNLLPWGIDSVEADDRYDGRTVTLNFYLPNNEKASVEILFLGGRTIVVQTEDSPRMRIYHPANSKPLDALTAYLKTHGVTE